MRNYRITTIGGIPIQINVSLLVFLPILAWLIGTGTQIEFYANLIDGATGVTMDLATLTAGNNPWVIGTAAGLGLFVSVGVHELGHAWAAARYGIGTESITLWILGGLASLESMPKEWNREFWIAIAGPVTSLLVAGVCYGALIATPASAPVIAFIFGWLFLTNILLAVFNMLPAFPMDGGRVVRALLARTRPYASATRIAARLGTVFALLFAIVGVLSFSPILVLLSLFIYAAATGESRMVALEALLTDVTATDMVGPDQRAVDPETTVEVLLNSMVSDRRTSYPVVEDDRVVGVVTLKDLKQAKGRENEVSVRDVMKTEIETISPLTPAFEVFTVLSEGDATAAVIEDGSGRVGVVTAADLGEFLQFRKEEQSLRPRVAM